MCKLKEVLSLFFFFNFFVAIAHLQQVSWGVLLHLDVVM